MERLTKRYTYNGKPEISVDSEENGVSCSNFCTNCGKADCGDIRKALFKLAAYEDLEEQGLLLKLPCKVGDTIYHICTFENGESEIINMKVCCVDPCGAIRNHKGTCEIWNVYAETDYTKEYFKFCDFGKTVFLTHAEAEEALRKMNGTEEWEMSDDLISRRALFNALFVYNGKMCPNNDIDNFPITINVEDIKEAIRNAPTAYDVDKVVEQLEEMLLNLTFHKNKGNKEWNKAIHKAIEIVKSGMKE